MAPDVRPNLGQRLEALAHPEPTDQRDFDAACNEFTELLVHARNWKHSYFGACYSSRVRAAVEDIRRAIEIAETRIIGK